MTVFTFGSGFDTGWINLIGEQDIKIKKGKVDYKFCKLINNTCLVPYSYSMIYNQLMEANLWEIYCTLMPRQRHESEKRYKNLKRASLS
jgi:hypothetical protein